MNRWMPIVAGLIIASAATGCAAPEATTEARGDTRSAETAPSVATIEIVVKEGSSDVAGLELRVTGAPKSGLHYGDSFEFHLSRGSGFGGDRRPFQLSGPWTSRNGDDGYFVLGALSETSPTFTLKAPADGAAAEVHVFAQMEVGLGHGKVDATVALPIATRSAETAGAATAEADTDTAATNGAEPDSAGDE